MLLMPLLTCTFILMSFHEGHSGLRLVLEAAGTGTLGSSEFVSIKTQSTLQFCSWLRIPDLYAIEPKVCLLSSCITLLMLSGIVCSAVGANPTAAWFGYLLWHASDL